MTASAAAWPADPARRMPHWEASCCRLRPDKAAAAGADKRARQKRPSKISLKFFLTGTGLWKILRHLHGIPSFDSRLNPICLRKAPA